MNARRLGVRAALLDGKIVPGDVTIADGEIETVGAGPPGATGIAVPGFIDLQVNGFGGIDFLNTEVAGFFVAGEALLSTGVTAYQPTLISSPREMTVKALEVIAKAQLESGPRILGVHLEGPFLARKWKGAHDENNIVEPDLQLAERLCDAGPVTYMTIAPERPGGFELLAWLLRRGIAVSLGHTDADAETAHRAYGTGAKAVTHLFNAQRRFAPRDPGISGAALARDDVVVQVIADLVHLSAETLKLAWRCARGRLALVTDAIAPARAATGAGEYPLGDRKVFVDGDAARLADGTLAGSVLSLDRAVRNMVALGAPLPEILEAVTRVPAKLIGRPELGTLGPGTPADVTVLDDALEPQRTLVYGQELWSA